MNASIKIDGEAIDLPKGASIRIEKPSGLLQLDSMEPTITQQFRLPPTPLNQRLFAHLERPASASVFAPIDGAMLEYRNLAIAEGQFVINSASRRGLEGFFRADAGALAEARDRKIGDILAGLSVVIGVGAYPHTDAPFSNGLNDDVVFPPAIGRSTPAYRIGRTAVRYDRSALYGGSGSKRNFAKAYDRNIAYFRDRTFRAKTEEFANTKQGVEEMVVYNTAPPYTYGRAVPKKYLPAFKLMHLLDELMKALGYSLEVVSPDYTMRQAVLFAWRPAIRNLGESARSYSYFLPYLTLSEFLSSMRAMGISIYIDSRAKKVTAAPFTSVAYRPAKDLSYCADSEPKISEAFGDEPSTFSWGIPSSMKATMAGVNSAFELPDAQLGAVVLVKDENKFYEAQAITVGDASFVDWRPSEAANIDGAAARGAMDVQSLFVPVSNSLIFYFTAENVKIRKHTIIVEDPPGVYTSVDKVKLEGFLYRGLKKGEVQYRIIEPEELSTGWYTDLNPTAAASDDPVLNIAYTKDYDNAVVEYRTNLGYFGSKLMPDIPEEVAPYIALHHGEVESAESDLYGYAGPTSFLPDGSGDRIDVQDLTWESILANRMLLAKTIMEQGKEAAHTLYPKLADAVQFSPFNPVIIDGVHYLPISFDADLGEVLKAEFRGWVV
jgi:hypothetical protein